MKNTSLSVNTKSNEVVTVNTKSNNEKSNKLLNVNELNALFVEVGLLPRFVCDGFYVGCGIGRTNVLSVNTRSKWSTYKVFCDNDRFEQLKKSKIDGITLTANGNATDKTRPNVVEVKTTEVLKTVLQFVAKSNNALCITK